MARGKPPFFKYPGKPLPKRILRPFVLHDPYYIDDRQYVLVSRADRKGIVFSWALFMYVIAGGAVLGTLATRVTEPGPMVVAVVALGIGVALHYWGRGLKQTVFNVFDREAGTVRFPKGGFFSDEVTEGPWEEWGGRLWIMSSRTGIPRHVLSLVHFPTYRVFMV